MDYETVIQEKFPKNNVEVIQPDIFELDELAEYIADDVTVYNPHLIIIYRHLIRFLVNVNCRGKMYYLEGFSDGDLSELYSMIQKLTFKMNVKFNIFPDADPDVEVLGIKY